MFSEFSLNEFLSNSYEPLVRFSNRIFRVALLFICQCSFFFFVAFLSDATLIDYHKLLYLVKNFFQLFHFLMLESDKVVYRFIGLPQRRNLSYHYVFHLSTGNCIFFHLFFLFPGMPIFSPLSAIQLSFYIEIVGIV